MFTLTLLVEPTIVRLMGSRIGGRRHRVFVPQALGSDEFLRVTWHEPREVVVFSQWKGDECTAAIPVRVADLHETASLLADAVGMNGSVSPPTRPPPSSSDLVVPAAGLSVPAVRRSA